MADSKNKSEIKLNFIFLFNATCYSVTSQNKNTKCKANHMINKFIHKHIYKKIQTRIKHKYPADMTKIIMHRKQIFGSMFKHESHKFNLNYRLLCEMIPHFISIYYRMCSQRFVVLLLFHFFFRFGRIL